MSQLRKLINARPTSRTSGLVPDITCTSEDVLARPIAANVHFREQPHANLAEHVAHTESYYFTLHQRLETEIFELDSGRVDISCCYVPFPMI